MAENDSQWVGDPQNVMSRSREFVVAWTRVGIATGLLACVVYPLLIAVPLPGRLAVVLAAAFGPLLGFASIGLYQFLRYHRKTVSLQIAVVSNIVAGAIVNLMLVVQMTVREFWRMGLEKAADESAEQALRTAYSAADKVQLGLDVSWDVYIGVGTLLFGLNMLRHPRLGRAVGAAGMLVGAAVLAFNFAAFPVPPADAGSIDVGPLVGLWYLVVTVMLWRSLGWLRTAATPG